MMRRVTLLACVLPVALSGCASGFPGARPLTYATPGEAHVFATGEKCAHEPADKEFGPLVAAALTGAASQLLKNFGTALTEGAKGGALPSSTSTLNLQLEPGKVPKCVVVIRGSFQPAGKDVAAIPVAAWLGLVGDPEVTKRLDGLHMPPIYRIDHYIEIRVGASNNSKALTFAPLYVRLVKSIDGSAKGKRDLSVSLKFNRPGVEAVGSAIVIADRQVGAAASKWSQAGNGRYPIEAPWFATFHAAPSPAGAAAGGAVGAVPAPTPAAPPAAGPVGGGGAGAGGGGIGAPPAGAPGSAIPSMQSAAADAVPVTLTATVVETRPTNEGLAFVAAVFNGVQPKIEEAIKPIFSTDARSADEVASLGAQADFAAAEGAARAALIGYCKASSADATAAGQQDRINKSKDARSAQLKANVAAIKADVDQPFPRLVVISDQDPMTTNSASCTGL